ncbi:hypothetical protein [Arthrobacter sp. HS15c]|uniref:hypothetical protein n=1 Tax=Arthrobacter sp. HS15c TaxID=3230279 RepID=UPI00346779FC
MTEQPVETEQQFLGNETPNACANCSARIRRTVGLVCPACGRDFSDAPPAEATVGESEDGSVEFIFIPEPTSDAAFLPAQQAALDKARQHYVPGAHLRRPSWAPADDVEVSALIRKCTHAATVLAIAKRESVKAEEELKTVLGVEEEAVERMREAERALIAYTRKDTGL